MLLTGLQSDPRSLNHFRGLTPLPVVRGKGLSITGPARSGGTQALSRRRLMDKNPLLLCFCSSGFLLKHLRGEL